MNTHKTLKIINVSVLAAAVLMVATSQLGCGGNCKRIEKDWVDFFARTGTDDGAHIEVIVPFKFAEKLIDKQLAKMKPVPLKLPISGKLQSYFGGFEVVPTSVKLLPARKGRVGFRINFDVENDGETAFSMAVETEVKPKVDLTTGKIEIGLEPEAFGSIKPKLGKDSKEQLGALVYRRIPKLLRGFVPKKTVDNAAASVLKKLVSNFYKRSKDKLLPRLGIASTVSIDLPPVPAKKLTFSTFDNEGGGLRLLFYSELPIKTGIDPDGFDFDTLKKGQVSVRMSGSTVAELANWAIAQGLVPDRYNKKGKPKDNGDFRPGLAWIPGKRPMKVYLWQIERPCKRITIGTKPTVSVKKDKIQIKTKNTEIEDVEATAIAEVGIWFATLWKDAVDVRKSAGSKMTFKIAGEQMVSKIKRATLENDELVLGISLQKQ